MPLADHVYAMRTRPDSMQVMVKSCIADDDDEVFAKLSLHLMRFTFLALPKTHSLIMHDL